VTVVLVGVEERIRVVSELRVKGPILDPDADVGCVRLVGDMARGICAVLAQQDLSPPAIMGASVLGVGRIAAAHEGMNYCAMDLVPIAPLLAEAMTLVVGLVAVLVDFDLRLFSEDMSNSDLGEVVAPGTGAGVLRTSC
jgi:hypothetical protein